MKERIIIVGYSLSVGDERFKERIRKVIGNLIVVDPNFEAVIGRACRIVNQDKRV